MHYGISRVRHFLTMLSANYIQNSSPYMAKVQLHGYAIHTPALGLNDLIYRRNTWQELVQQFFFQRCLTKHQLECGFSQIAMYMY